MIDTIEPELVSIALLRIISPRTIAFLRAEHRNYENAARL